MSCRFVPTTYYLALHETFGKSKNAKVMDYFFRNPSKKAGVKELCEDFDREYNPNALLANLRDLHYKGLLTRDTVQSRRSNKGRKVYSLDTSSEIARKALELENLIRSQS